MKLNKDPQRNSYRVQIDEKATKYPKIVVYYLKAKKLLDFKILLKLYYSFIQTYLNFANITWSSTNKIKFYNLQNHALR